VSVTLSVIPSFITVKVGNLKCACPEKEYRSASSHQVLTGCSFEEKAISTKKPSVPQVPRFSIFFQYLTKYILGTPFFSFAEYFLTLFNETRVRVSFLGLGFDPDGWG